MMNLPSFQKRSPFKEAFNHALSRMSEGGVFDRVLARWRLEHPDCKPRPGRALGFNNMAMAFVIFTGGFVSAAGLLFLEIVWRNLSAGVESSQVKDVPQVKSGWG